MIAEQGENAPVAAFIFGQYDVYTIDDDDNIVHEPVEIAAQVLSNLESDYDHIYEDIFSCIDTELSMYHWDK